MGLLWVHAKCAFAFSLKNILWHLYADFYWAKKCLDETREKSFVHSNSENKNRKKKKQNRKKKLQKALIVSVLGAWCLIIFILCFLHISFLFLTCISVFVHFCHSFCLYFDRVTNAIIPTLLLPRLFECFGERHFVVAYYFRFCSSFLKIVMFFFVFFVVRNSFSFVWFRFISFCLLFLFVRIILAVSYCRCQTIEISWSMSLGVASIFIQSKCVYLLCLIF